MKNPCQSPGKWKAGLLCWVDKVSGARPDAEAIGPLPARFHSVPVHHSLPAGHGAEPDTRLPARDEPPPDHRRRSICLPRPPGPGQVPAAGTVEEPAPENAGVDCEGLMASIAHKVMEAVRRLGLGIGAPGPDAPPGYGQLGHPWKSSEPVLSPLYPTVAVRPSQCIERVAGLVKFQPSLSSHARPKIGFFNRPSIL